MSGKNSAVTFKNAKKNGERLAMLTAYDYSTAKLMDETGINGILVGDSLGNVILGYEDTISVTMEDMIHHGAAVARGTKNALVVIDMPFMSYQTSVYDALVNAGRLMKEGRAGAVKLEGGKNICPQIEAITKAGIPVMGHLGLTPQAINAFGGFKVQGKTQEAAEQLIGGCTGSRESGSICTGTGMCSTETGGYYYGKINNTYHWHRGRKWMRRTDSGISGSAWYVF